MNSLHHDQAMSRSNNPSPTRVLPLEVSTNTAMDFRMPKVPADFSRYVTEQVLYKSKIGLD